MNSSQRFVNYLLAILGSMFNARNAICLSLLIAFIVGANWALTSLSQSLEFSRFMIFGAVCTVVCGLLRCYLTEGDCARIPHHGRDW